MSIVLNNRYNTAARKDSICQAIPYLLFSLERLHYCNPVAGSLTDKQKFYLKEARSFVLEKQRQLGTGVFLSLDFSCCYIFTNGIRKANYVKFV